MMRSKTKSFLYALAVIAAAALLSQQFSAAAAPVPAATATDKPAGARLFYASHSLMWDMPPVLQQEAEAYGIKGHAVLGIQRLGVSQTSQHWNLPDDQNEAKKALKAGNVDVFVMSPIILPDDAVMSFVKLGLEHNKNMKFMVQISWPGLGLTDNNDFSMGGGGGIGGAPGGRRGAAPGGRGPATQPTPPTPVPGGPAGRLDIPDANPLASFMRQIPSFATAAPAPTPAPPAGGAPAPGARRGAGGPGGGFPGGGGFGGPGGGGQNYEKTAQELAVINAKNNKAAEEQAKKINDEIGRQVIFLVPTAQAHNAMRLAILKKEMPAMTTQGEMFRDTIGHPTQPMIALNSYLHFAVLYNRSPVGLPQPAMLKGPVTNLGWKDGYQDPKLNAKLQEMAWEIVSHYPPSGVTAAVK